MKKLSKLIFTLPLAALSLNSASATRFTVEETQLLYRTSMAEVKSIFTLAPPLAADDTLDDLVNRLGGVADDAILASIDATAPADIPTAIATTKTSLGNAAAFDAAHAAAAAAIPATAGPGVAGQFVDGTDVAIGPAIGVSGTAGAEDVVNQEMRSLLRLAFRRLSTGIDGLGAAPGIGALNDGNDTALGLGLATAALGVATENTMTLADLVRVLYAIRLKD
jgi:hypothetical protein